MDRRGPEPSKWETIGTWVMYCVLPVALAIIAVLDGGLL